MGIGGHPSLATSKPFTPSKLKARTRTPTRHFRAASPTSSSVIVEVSSIYKDDVDLTRKDSVELSMHEKRRFGGQEAASEKLTSKLSRLEKRKEVEKFHTIKPETTTGTLTESQYFMSRFPYKSCQRSVVGELRKKRSLSQTSSRRCKRC